jgi:predicted CxxxxCH...CXXCH cytochrome family protein
MCDAARSRNPGAVITCAVLASCGGATPSGTRDAQADLHADVAPAELSDPRAAICATASAAGVTAAPPFDVVQQIFDTNCVYCHSQGADVDLSAAVAWGNLVGRPAPPTESCGGTLVVPGDASASYLYQKLSSDQPCSGARMPRSEFGSDALPDCVTALVASWIAAGAPGPGVDAGGGD